MMQTVVFNSKWHVLFDGLSYHINKRSGFCPVPANPDTDKPAFGYYYYGKITENGQYRPKDYYDVHFPKTTNYPIENIPKTLLKKMRYGEAQGKDV